jgi:hypothetical protein
MRGIDLMLYAVYVFIADRRILQCGMTMKIRTIIP